MNAELGEGYAPGVVNRVEKAATTHSAPRPEQYSDEFEWAGAWVADNGVTLPPATTEYRKLRNWFGNQNNRFKLGKLTEKVKDRLAQHGIDFSQYRALNTGKGERQDDAPFIEAMHSRFAKLASYDLGDDAEPSLIEWQSRLLVQFAAAGRTKRLATIEAQLPGLNFGRWGKPSQSRTHDKNWWKHADEFRRNRETPAFRGVLHPRTPEPSRSWANEQQRIASAGPRGQLTLGQRGELVDLGILANPSQREATKKRTRAKRDLGAPQRLAPSDQRLDTYLGAACLVRLLVAERELLDLCTEFAVDPASMEHLLRKISAERKVLRALDPHDVRRTLTTCRQLELVHPGLFNSRTIARLDKNPDQRPAALEGITRTVGLAVERISQHAKRLAISQDIA